MSIAEVTARIQTIQAQIAQLSPTALRSTASTSAGSASSAATFAQALQEATDTLAGTSSSSSAEAKAVVAEAKKYLGVPYVWGGTDPTKGLDCSGLVQLVYKNLGYELPRVSHQQATAGRPVASMAEAQPGDLIAWDNSSRNNGVDHIAIYIGDGKMIEAPRRGLDVRIIDVPSTPDVIRRIIPDATTSSSSNLASTLSTQLSGQLSGQLSALLTSGLTTGLTTSAAYGNSTASTSGAQKYADLFEAAGAAHGVSPALLSAMAAQESSYDPGAVSPAGAQGLMQLMPATASSLGVTDSFDPAQSVDGAARLMRTLLDRFGSTELALAAYNAGPGAVIRHDGVPPYAETQNYVRAITSTLGATR